MSYFSGTFPKKFCRSDDHRPSNKPEPLYNDFWDTLYIKHKHDLLLQTIHEEAKDDSEEIELQDAESEEETADEDEKNNTDDGSSDRSDSEISFDGQIIQNENTEVYEKFEQFVGDNVDITIRFAVW